jgi:8-hydroxy-5-deazaflavin:NADPH oxidoreductase
VVSELGDGVSAGTVEQASAVGIVVIAVPWDRVPEAVQGSDRDEQVVILLQLSTPFTELQA